MMYDFIGSAGLLPRICFSLKDIGKKVLLAPVSVTDVSKSNCCTP